MKLKVVIFVVPIFCKTFSELLGY